jgi:pilus assembly protein Flp/PilA
LKLNINLEAFNMRNFLNSVKTLAKDQDGVVSLEYVIVAACVCGVVIAAYSAGGTLPAAIAAGFAKITTAMAAL